MDVLITGSYLSLGFRFVHSATIVTIVVLGAFAAWFVALVLLWLALTAVMGNFHSVSVFVMAGSGIAVVGAQVGGGYHAGRRSSIIKPDLTSS